MCGRYCQDALIITRNEESRPLLRSLGVPTELGTDTAWTFQPLPPEYGRKALTDVGWDGKLPVLIVCPINPFWWPVKPSLVKYAARSTTGGYKDSHYRTVYFHKSGHDVDAAFERYLTSIARAVDAFRQRRRVFPILVATEALDARACRRISEKLGGLPVFTSEEHDMYQIVSILRAVHLRTSLPARGIGAGRTNCLRWTKDCGACAECTADEPCRLRRPRLGRRASLASSAERGSARRRRMSAATYSLATMSFLNDIFAGLDSAADQALLAELRDGSAVQVNGRELRVMVAQARTFLVSRGLRKGDRCVLLAANRIRWVATDLAIMAEGLIVIPLYSRQAPTELVSMMNDCSPSLIICGDADLRDAIRREWPECPAQALFDDVFSASTDESASTEDRKSTRLNSSHT